MISDQSEMRDLIIALITLGFAIILVVLCGTDAGDDDSEMGGQ